ncbi:Ankyrin repeat-containing protein ITN1 [Sesamum angolense]|uniref:Ankyrin repeat-containing protein ITN1 n=1 Tax=Sesamum angolense TaxID=2727404 RepID=A0AAE2BNW6_9LAMI|nr:Ankyrin repeat-containing protein ITN1 [Sesamum angolense]
MGSIQEQGVRDLEMGSNVEPPSPLPSPSPSPRAVPLVVSNSSKSLAASNSGKALVVSNSGKALVVSNSGKKMDQSGKKKYVKQVTGRHNDTELHLAAQKGDVEAVRQIMGDINDQMLKTLGGAEFDAEVAEIRAAVVNEVNELGETALFTAAERGCIDVVKELLPYSTREGIRLKNNSGFDPLHIAASQGHHDIVRILLEHDPALSKTFGQSNATPLVSAATKGHLAVVNELLARDSSLLEIPRSNGKNALHLAARQGHIVNELLLLRDTNVNALSRDHKTALDIAEGLPLSEETVEIKQCLTHYGAVRANELNQPRDELRITVSEIKKDVHTQLEQARKTDKNVNGIAKELRKLHREGINNATNSVTVVAVLFATVAFAAIFTVPGGDDYNGEAVMVSSVPFKVFFISNAVALFTSLAVVVVQITVVRGEIKSERRVVEVINKLMWLASVCTTVAFIASSYIVVGRRYRWAAVLVTVIGAVTMAGVLGAMTFYVVKSRRIRKVRKREKYSRSGTNSWRQTETDSDVNPIYAI